MGKKRELAVPGQPVDLWLTVRDKLNKKVMQPTSIGDVRIYSPQGTLLATITPQFANPGTYLAQWTIPAAASPGQYKDIWTDIVTSEDNTAVTIEQIFIVREPEYETVTKVDDYKVSLVTREVIVGSKVYLQFNLVNPKNGVFPSKVHARYRKDHDSPVDGWYEVKTRNNEAFALFDSTGLAVGGYKVQLRLDFDSEVIITPEYHFAVREF